MNPMNILGVVALLSSTGAAMFYRTDAPCDFTDVAIDNDVFSRIIAKLPEDMEIGPQYYRPVLPGLEVGELVLHDLKKLRQFGSPIPHCVNGSRMVQVELYSEADTHFSAPWKMCSGDEGRITIRPMFARFTVQFRVVESTASGVKLEFDRALPVSTLSVRARVYGAGSSVNHAFQILSGLVPAFMEDLWTMQFFRHLNRAFRMINESNMLF